MTTIGGNSSLQG